MKNIHTLPTDKPSRLKQNKITKKYSLTTKGIDLTMYTPQNIYITSDEEIKEGWYFNKAVGVNKPVYVKNEDVKGLKSVYGENLNHLQKIVLTTDQDLIKDGVQAIDDEFLEWFVKNPTCERVEVEDFPMTEKYNSKGEYVHRSYWVYKIIIPRTTQQIINQDYAGGLEMGQIPAKEETKQEFPQPNIIDNWLEKNGDPEIDKQVEKEAKELCEQNKISQEELERAIFAPINLYSAIKFLFKQFKNK
jgi:hypothetical protein